jgi:ribonuclease HI
MDHKLSREPQIQATPHKILRRAFLIRMMTYGKNTLKIPLLIRIFKAMIRSAYDYGSTILTTIPKTRLEKLEQAQNQILRTIIGCFKSTPKALLNIETGIYPVKDRWDQLAYNYFLRLNEKPWNPAYGTIQELTRRQTTWKTNSTPAAITHLRKLDPTGKIFFKKPSSQTPEVEPLPPWKHFSIPTNYFPLTKKQATESNQTNQLFNSLTRNPNTNHLEVYTDGSVCESTKTASCAFHIPKKKESEAWLLKNSTNSFNAELYAIRQALYYLNKYEMDSATIFTDSKSSIQAISNFKWESSPAIPEIIKQIFNLNASGTRITLTWIPSHAGIVGNEIADQLATNIRKDRRNATTKTITNKIDVRQNIATAKANHKNITFQKLKTQSTNMAVTSRECFGYLPWHTNKKRTIQSALFRLRSGHNKLNHFISRLEPETLADCPNGCPEREDATHVLLHCQHYTEARSEMERNLSPLKIPLGLPTSFFIRICFL